MNPIITELCELQDKFPVTIIYIDDREGLGYCYRSLEKALPPPKVDENVDTWPENMYYAQYHMCYPTSDKNIILKEIRKTNPTIRLILATVSLGMGLNAPSVETIIHFRPPVSLEAFIQASGRAGRNGAPSSSIMYFCSRDLAANRKGMTDDMRLFCKSQACLRTQLLNYLGFDNIFDGDCSMCCSVCKVEQ
jgi:superfamily II DNA helicase RecQ